MYKDNTTPYWMWCFFVLYTYPRSKKSAKTFILSAFCATFAITNIYHIYIL